MHELYVYYDNNIHIINSQSNTQYFYANFISNNEQCTNILSRLDFIYWNYKTLKFLNKLNKNRKI